MEVIKVGTPTMMVLITDNFGAINYVVLCRELGAELVALGSVQGFSVACSVQQMKGFLSLLL